MKRILAIATIATIAGSALLAAAGAWADPASPVGLWKNIDDKTGKSKALIRIIEINGELIGKIEKIFPEPGQTPTPKCDKCEGALKDQPIVGLTILSGMKRDGDEYNGGKILDPDNGKVYSSKLSLIEAGKKLNVRGFIGMPFLGRSQIWLREE
jgi:uncharacterized protein (DUF2147 family)